ncbi:MAG: hypothetical protein IPK99_17900 [Flavobacteriales bacterium]|nr:hypothetical protein [Flavobacteriales bacterium]
MLLTKKDHKRIGDGDTGPEHRRMGGVVSCELRRDKDLHAKVHDRIAAPTVRGFGLLRIPVPGLQHFSWSMNGGYHEPCSDRAQCAPGLIPRGGGASCRG